MTQCDCGAWENWEQRHDPMIEDPRDLIHQEGCQVVQRAMYEGAYDL